MRRHPSWKLVLLAMTAGLLALTASPSAPLRGPAEAQAAISVAYTLKQIVGDSAYVVVAKATDRRSLWEKVAGSKRIVTYTRIEIVETVYGKPGKTLWIRTLGGVVGKIGQTVAGEARLAIGKEGLLFLTRTSDSKTVVTGAAQGHFPIVEPEQEDEPRRLTLSPHRGKVVRPKGKRKSAVTVQKALGGVKVDAGVAKIRAVKAELDEARKKQKK